MEGTDAGGDVRYLKGIYINVARLYAVMARASGIEVKVVIGKGFDGIGGSDTYAWNKVNVGGEAEYGFRWMQHGRFRRLV